MSFKSVENTYIQKRIVESQKRTYVFSGANWTTWMIQMGYDVNHHFLYQRDIKNLTSLS